MFGYTADINRLEKHISDNYTSGRESYWELYHRIADLEAKLNRLLVYLGVEDVHINEKVIVKKGSERGKQEH